MRSSGRWRVSMLAMALAAWVGWSAVGGETSNEVKIEDTPPASQTPAPLPEQETAYFNGVEPGVSTAADVEQAWGKPIHSTKDRGQLRNSYTMEPFERAEVIFAGDKAEAIVIYLKENFAPDLLAAELGLTNCEPVTVFGNNGAAVGQAYPERGVALSYQTATEPPRVARIMIERPSAEAYLLRARHRLPYRVGDALADLSSAIAINPQFAEAHALEAQVFSALGRHSDARASIALAAPADEPRHRLLAARIAADLGDFDEAIEATKKVIATDVDGAVKAWATCQLGDLLAESPSGQLKLALEQHEQAVKLAQQAMGHGGPQARRMARAVLIDAHLAMAQDIAQGSWKMKPQVVDKWLDRTVALAEDNRALGDGEAADMLLISRKALAACAALDGQLDPTPWTEALLAGGRRSLEKSHDALSKQRIEWQMGIGLFDATRALADRGDYDLAVTHGERAVELLEGLASDRQLTPTEHYTLGRLYFRLGSMAAIQDKDHKAARNWFDQSLVELAKSTTAVPAGDMRRAGDTLVSMAVSYWAAGEQEKAISLTRQGIQWIERAIDERRCDQRALSVPYVNMATMLRFRGDEKKAGEYETMAARVDANQTR